MKQPIVVTGASGFLGFHFVQQLIAADCPKVICLLREQSDDRRLIHPAIKVCKGNLFDPQFLRGSMEGASTLVHCAAMVTDWATVTEIQDANVRLTDAVTRAAAAAGVQRMIHVSTTDVYGHPGTPSCNETTPPGNGHFNWYAHTKLEAERIVMDSHPDWVILRPSTIYGPGSISIFAEIADAVRGGWMLTVNGGKADMGLVYVSDVAKAMLLAVQNNSVSREIFNISGDGAISWAQLIADLSHHFDCKCRVVSLPSPVAQATGWLFESLYRHGRALLRWHCRPLLSRQAVQIMTVNQSFSHAKATKQLGYSPEVDYNEGFHQSVDWLKKART